MTYKRALHKGAQDVGKHTLNPLPMCPTQASLSKVLNPSSADATLFLLLAFGLFVDGIRGNVKLWVRKKK